MRVWSPGISSDAKSNMKATECDRPSENKHNMHARSTIVWNKLLNQAHVCVTLLIFSLFHFETSLLCALWLPCGITLIKPNTLCVIAFSLKQKHGRALTYLFICFYFCPVWQNVGGTTMKEEGGESRLIFSPQLTVQGCGFRIPQGVWPLSSAFSTSSWKSTMHLSGRPPTECLNAALRVKNMNVCSPLATSPLASWKGLIDKLLHIVRVKM